MSEIRVAVINHASGDPGIYMTMPSLIRARNGGLHALTWGPRRHAGDDGVA